MPEFKESDHPRDADGKFGAGGSGTKHIDTLSANLTKLSAPILNGLGKFKNSGIDNRKSVESALKSAGMSYRSEFSNGNYPMGIHRETGEIIINSNSSVWDKLQSKLDAKFNEGHLSTNAKGALITHELAHQMLGDLGNKEFDENEKKIAAQVSKYAATNHDEFVAEFLAGTLGGAKYSDDVKQLFMDLTEKSIKSDSEPDETKVPDNELDIARKIQSGELTSPQHFGNVWLFNIRITGTGTAYRSKGNEFAFRPPEHYMNDEFLARCNGLQVIYEHPEKGTLNSKEFKKRSIGAIFLPYLKHEANEVWGIAKVYDDEAALDMIQHQLSTSPTVVGVGTKIVEVEDGTEVLIEGSPRLLDHVAICSMGVWDKGGDASGVVSDSVTNKVDKMTEEELKAKADAEEAAKTAKADSEDKMTKFMDSVGTFMDSMTKRMDSFEEAAKPKPVVADKKADAAEEEEKAKADAAAKAKADSEVQAKIDAVAAQIPKAMSDSDFAAMADCQSKADSVASAFGESASRPQMGESVLGYRKRLAAKFKAHSKEFAGVDITAIADSALFDIVEKKIYADAFEAANNPVMSEGEGLREIKSRSPAGHQISTFKGRISSWMNQFKADAFKVTQLNTGSK
jgi:hypothetical protein